MSGYFFIEGLGSSPRGCDRLGCCVEGYCPYVGPQTCNTPTAEQCQQPDIITGILASEACPVACQTGCGLTYDDCCASTFRTLTCTTTPVDAAVREIAGGALNLSNRCHAGNNPCLNGGVCTDDIGRFTCECSGTDYYGTTCEICQDVPCEDDPSFSSARSYYSCAAVGSEGYCDSDYYADALTGVLPSEACPISCHSGCSLTYDDCCTATSILHCTPADRHLPHSFHVRLCHAEHAIVCGSCQGTAHA